MARSRVLLVMNEDMLREFRALASAESVEWAEATTCNQARRLLDDEISMVVTDETLPDGNWYCLLREVVQRGAQPEIVVVLPAGSDPTSVKSCGVEVVEYPLTAAARRLLAGYMLQEAKGAPVS